MSPVFVPQEAMTGWIATIVQFNPVTYLLRGMRSLINEGWVVEDILGALAGIAAIGLISIPLASWALRGRVRRR